MKNNLKCLPLALVITASACCLSLSVQAQPQINPDQGSQVVQGAPVVSKEEKKLQYWDASKPLTVGDMSEIHRNKLAEDFLSQHGFTTHEQPKPVLSSAIVKPKPLPKPPHSLHVRAIYGLKQSPSADVIFDGSTTTVKEGSTLKNDGLLVSIKKDAEGKLVAYAEKSPAKKCKPTKKKSCKPAQLTQSHLLAGETVEWNR